MVLPIRSLVILISPSPAGFDTVLDRKPLRISPRNCERSQRPAQCRVVTYASISSGNASCNTVDSSSF